MHKFVNVVLVNVVPGITVKFGNRKWSGCYEVCSLLFTKLHICFFELQCSHFNLLILCIH